jgi:hypothetical protein
LLSEKQLRLPVSPNDLPVQAKAKALCVSRPYSFQLIAGILRLFELGRLVVHAILGQSDVFSKFIGGLRDVEKFSPGLHYEGLP